jgi:hypothetical protein
MFCTNPLTIFELLLPSLGFEGTTFDDFGLWDYWDFVGVFDEVVFIVKEEYSRMR